MSASRLAEPLVIETGTTFRQPFLLLQGVYVSKTVAEVKRGMPTLVVVPNHGLADGWPAWLEITGGCSSIAQPRNSAPFYADVVDENTLRFANDNTQGQQAPQQAMLIYSPPEDLSDVTGAVFEVYRLPEKALIDSFTSANGEVLISSAGKVTLQLSAQRTAALQWTRARFRLLLTLANGDVVSRLLGDFQTREGL